MIYRSNVMPSPARSDKLGRPTVGDEVAHEGVIGTVIDIVGETVLVMVVIDGVRKRHVWRSFVPVRRES